MLEVRQEVLEVLLPAGLVASALGFWFSIQGFGLGDWGLYLRDSGLKIVGLGGKSLPRSTKPRIINNPPREYPHIPETP